MRANQTRDGDADAFAKREPLGVSCVICCHNGAQRLPATLAHLSRQVVPAGLRWEVVVIDNLSTDGTADTARAAWKSEVPLRIVVEPELGLSSARMRALSEARWEIISFIDDDNWVGPDWVRRVSERMTADDRIGLLGGHNIPEGEAPFPKWFEALKRFYAVASSEERSDGDVTDTGKLLCGAGLSIRKQAMSELVRSGFRFSTTGRQGTRMTAADDHELVLALKLRGWRLWYDRDLSLRHYIPATRLTWEYAKRLLRGIGESSVQKDPYLLLVRERSGLQVSPWRLHWLWRAAASFRLVVSHLWRGILRGGGLREGCPEMALAQREWGRVVALCRLRSGYQRRRTELSRAPWLNS